MNAKACCSVVLVLVLAVLVQATGAQTAGDLRRGVPQAAHMAVHGRHNPERDYQLAYLKDVWQTLQEERIVERALDIVTSRLPDDKMEKVSSAMEQLHAALRPAFDAILSADEVLYAQVMELPVNHHLFVLQLPSKDVGEVERAVVQLFDLIQEWSGGELTTVDQWDGGVHVVLLKLPKNVPLSPALLRIGDVVIISTSERLARQSAAMLQGNGPDSKFDDPRFVEALTHLPEPENAVFFFDGRLLLEKIREFSDFIRQQNPQQNEKIERVSGIIEVIVDELAIVDYDLTVEYTEGRQNRTAAICKLSADAKDKLLYQAVTQGRPFENWHTWVPAEAEAYSLNTGVNLHLIYEWIVQLLRTEIPELQEVLDDLERKQLELDFHLDRDILQAFSGESVSVTVPIETNNGSTTRGIVTALRCNNPDRVRELIARGVKCLADLKPFHAQELKLVECEGLEGFQELKATTLAMFGVRPLIGFDADWMLISCRSEAVAQVLAVRRGEAESIDQTESFLRFNLDSEGPVYAVGYTDIQAAVEQAAQTIEQIGAVVSVIVGMSAGQHDAEDLQPVQEALALLPSVTKVVRSVNFMEDKLCVTREGPLEGSYRRDTVINIKAPDDD